MDARDTADGKGKKKSGADRGRLNLTPAQLLVIAGFLGGSLEFHSVLVRKDQTLEIVLTGSLGHRTKLDRFVE